MKGANIPPEPKLMPNLHGRLFAINPPNIHQFLATEKSHVESILRFYSNTVYHRNIELGLAITGRQPAIMNY